MGTWSSQGADLVSGIFENVDECLEKAGLGHSYWRRF